MISYLCDWQRHAFQKMREKLKENGQLEEKTLKIFISVKESFDSLNQVIFFARERFALQLQEFLQLCNSFLLKGPIESMNLEIIL